MVQTDEKNLIIVGASTRAAACSALRAGFVPWCADLFADADLARRATVRRCVNYPRGLPDMLRDAPPGPWMYTGAVENCPPIVSAIGAERELYGANAAMLRAVRDPWRVAEALRRHNVPVPALARWSAPPNPAGGWLIKRRHSAGGQQVRRWDGSLTRGTRATHYYQAYVEGTPCSAVYVVARRQARLLGTTEQLIGPPWLQSGEFRYAGSVGPLECSTLLLSHLAHIGEALGALDLVGLIGVDFVRNDQGAWPIEINPRYTASVEILERACDFFSIRCHVQACRDGRLPSASSVSPLPSTRHGKAILFADRELVVTPKLSEMLLQRAVAGSWPEIADIPAADTTIKPGWPILTVFASGESFSAVKDALHARVAELREFVYGGNCR